MTLLLPRTATIRSVANGAGAEVAAQGVRAEELAVFDGAL
jgi:hypothetical protein